MKLATAGLGAIAAIIAIYTFIEGEKETRIEFQILSQANVIDLNVDVARLDVLYDSTSLKQTGQSLQVAVLRLSNIGGVDITKHMYDEDVPFGLHVLNGQVIETPEVLNCSNQYLQEHVRISFDGGQVKIAPIILDASQYFEMKLLVLQQRYAPLDLIATGKISGIEEIAVSDISSELREQSLWREAFQGSALVQLVRALLYFISVLLLIIGVVALIAWVSRLLSKRKRSRLVLDFIAGRHEPVSAIERVVLNRYISDSFYPLREILKLTEDATLLNRRYRRALERLEKRSKSHIELSMDDTGLWNRGRLIELVENLISDGIVMRKGEELVINEIPRLVLFQFSGYLDRVVPEKVRHSRRVGDLFD